MGRCKLGQIYAKLTQKVTGKSQRFVFFAENSFFFIVVFYVPQFF